MEPKIAVFEECSLCHRIQAKREPDGTVVIDHDCRQKPEGAETKRKVFGPGEVQYIPVNRSNWESRWYHFMLRVMGVVQPDNHEDIIWFTEGPYAPVSFFVNIGSLFCWGWADSEEITWQNVELFEQTYKELAALEPRSVTVTMQAQSLFACRSRKMRPQGACYPDEHPELWPLFDACGPEREVGMGNPYRPGERKKAVEAAKAKEQKAEQ